MVTLVKWSDINELKKKSKKQGVKLSNFKLNSEETCAAILKDMLLMKLYNESSTKSLSLIRSTTQTTTNQNLLMRCCVT